MTGFSYPAQIIRVHDGDTVLLTNDLGFGVKYTINCRLYGINAPELSTDAGKAARDHILTIIPPGTQVTVDSFGWDKYGGRFDGVIVLADGTNVNQKMVADGFAVPYKT